MKSVGKIFREDLVSRVKKGIEDNNSVFLVSYRNISGMQLSDFRKDMKKVGAQVYVTRNTIAQLAFKELEKGNLSEKVEGQTAIVWSNEDSVEVSKTLVKFVKEFEDVIIQGGLLDERVLEKDDVKKLADLPSKDVLRSQLLAIIQAPITRLMGAMNAKSRDLLSILKQYSEQKEGGN